VGVGLALFAEPLTTAIYGHQYEDAVTAVRLLGGAAALYAVSYLSSYLMVSQGRQRLIAWITGAVAVENVVLNLLVIPRWSFNGAAAVTSISELTHAVAFLIVAQMTVGRIALGRVALGPAVGALGMLAAALLIDFGLGGMLVAAAAYVLLLIAVERWLYPDDVKAVVGLVRPLLRRGPVPEPGVGAVTTPPGGELD
jgi:O-antigen/teichoic acid export membrane protein